MSNQVKRTISIARESDFEIHRLAKIWGIPVSQARERCYHYTAACYDEVSAGDLPSEAVADLRQAEAKVEMLKLNQ